MADLRNGGPKSIQLAVHERGVAILIPDESWAARSIVVQRDKSCTRETRQPYHYPPPPYQHSTLPTRLHACWAAQRPAQRLSTVSGSWRTPMRSTMSSSSVLSLFSAVKVTEVKRAGVEWRRTCTWSRCGVANYVKSTETPFNCLKAFKIIFIKIKRNAKSSLSLLSSNINFKSDL